MNIVFFGTPGFSAYVLKEIINSSNKVIYTVTTRDSKQGRGKKILSSPVKRMSLLNNIPILQPKSLNDISFIKELEDLNPDLFIVVAFQKLPENVWSIPKKGSVNLHTSLLPNYRGAAPINQVLINGENETGVTTFFINNDIDKGNIILQEKVLINTKTTAGQLHNILMEKGSILTLKTIDWIKNSNIKTKQQKILQDHKYAKKLTKDLFKINWNRSAKNIHNLVRGLSPMLEKDNYLKDVAICPGAWFSLMLNNQKRRIKLYKTEIIKNTGKIKSIDTDNKTYLHVALKDYTLSFIYLQMEGKKIMHIKDFLSGYKLDEASKIL